MAKVIEQIVRLTVDGEETKAEVIGELIRCKDCKWFNDYEVACDPLTCLVPSNSNDYCSKGERKETGDATN